jgi:hypothetical protein
MGKWASQRKRGSAVQFGILGAIPLANLSIGTITSTAIGLIFSGSPPAPATQFGEMIVRVSDGTVMGVNWGPTSPRSVSGLTTVTSYRVYGTWGTNQTPMADWTLLGTFSTI